MKIPAADHFRLIKPHLSYIIRPKCVPANIVFISKTVVLL